jgi:hypothetical protein
LPFLARHLDKPKAAAVFCGTTWTLVVLSCAALFGALLPLWVAGALTVFGLFFLSFGLFVKGRLAKVPFGAVMFAPMVAVGLVLPAGRIPSLVLGERVDQISVKEASAHGDATWITFSDAKLGLEHAYTRHITWNGTKNHSSGDRYDHVAPLIHPGWSPAEPVSAWAICGSEERSCPDWTEPWDATVSLDEWKESNTGGLVDEACAARGLRSAPGAPLLLRVGSRNEVLEEQAQFALMILGIAFGSCGLVLPLWFSGHRRPPAPPRDQGGGTSPRQGSANVAQMKAQ